MKDMVTGYAKKFFKAEKLIKDDSKFDPATEPFFSKYAARQLLLELYEELRTVTENGTTMDPNYLRLIGMQAACQITLAIVAFDTEEMSIGEGHLKLCEDIVQDHETSRECAGITLALYNEYGVYHHRLDSEKGLEYLMRAEAFYNSSKLSNIDALPICDLFSGENSGEGSQKFEASFTLTLYFLAQVYAQKNPLKSAIYCHRTLKRQLDVQDDTFEHIDWSLNAATLAQYFISQNCFKQARHHLAASSLVLHQWNLKLNELEDESEGTRDKSEGTRAESEGTRAESEGTRAESEGTRAESEGTRAESEGTRAEGEGTRAESEGTRAESEGTRAESEGTRAKREEYRHRSADVNRCWAKYCYCLLISSKERLMADELIDIAYTDISTMTFYEQDGDVTKADTKSLYFENVDLSSYETIVTDKYVSIYAEAKPIFVLALQFLNKAQEYYTLDNMASDYIEIIQEQSKLYSMTLTFFEENSDNCAKLCKRAVDLLERVLTGVNPKFYLKYCQEIWHRLGQLYSNILDIKLEKHKTSTQRPTPESLKKINILIDKSILNFTTYLNSLPGDLVEGLVEPFLMSHFNIAALSRKYITYDKRVKLCHAKNSLKHFEIVLNYCIEHENSSKLISEYIPIAKELVVLLPVEIKRYEQELGPQG